VKFSTGGIALFLATDREREEATEELLTVRQLMVISRFVLCGEEETLRPSLKELKRLLCIGEY
jgi:hypothetical protein